MMYLRENEVGFDQESFGFPSIDGCHAVVYQTVAGLFGIHNLGGVGEEHFGDRADIFRDFVQGHASGASPGERLYGVCFATTRRGYRADANANWRRELNTFADRLGFDGPIYGYDLAGRPFPAGASVYVRYDKVGNACVIQVKPWNDADARRGDNPHDPDDYQHFGRRPRGLEFMAIAPRVIVDVTDAGLTTVYPVRL